MDSSDQSSKRVGAVGSKAGAPSSSPICSTPPSCRWKRTWLWRRLLDLCAELDVILELEIGIVGGVEDATDNEDIDRAKLYASPEDMVQVSEVLGTFDKGLYLLAAVFGNVHGVYKPGAVKLDPTILRDGQEAVADRFGDDARHNLVFHGGSGSSIDEIHETLGYGVVKMNIDTDCQYAYTRPIADHMFKNYDGVLKVGAEVGDKKTYDPRSYMKARRSEWPTVWSRRQSSSSRRANRSVDGSQAPDLGHIRTVRPAAIRPPLLVRPNRSRLRHRPAGCDDRGADLGQLSMVGHVLRDHRDPVS